MKKTFFILTILYMSIINVQAQTHYFSTEGYQESLEYIEETDTMEVIHEGDIYYYRNRNYLRVPDRLIINNYDFKFEDYMESNLPIEDYVIEHYCNYYVNQECAVEIKYLPDFSLGQLVTVAIPDNDWYINVPEKIIATTYDFDILNYIDTNIEDTLLIEGEINLHKNAVYPVSIKYRSKLANTVVEINIPDNNEVIIVPEKPNNVPIPKEKISETNPDIIENEKEIITEVKPVSEEPLETNVPIKINRKNQTTNSNSKIVNNVIKYGIITFLVVIVFILSKLIIRIK